MIHVLPSPDPANFWRFALGVALLVAAPAPTIYLTLLATERGRARFSMMLDSLELEDCSEDSERRAGDHSHFAKGRK